MPEPTHKSPEIENFLEGAFGRTTAIHEARCSSCQDPVAMEDFRDDLSRKEYRISGLCQKCQDSVWGSPEEDEED